MSFRSKPVGWRGESYRHYLARKGVKSRYYSLYRELPAEGLRRTFVNPEGKKIIYTKGLEVPADERGVYASPEDIAYTIDELPPELTPGDVMVMSRRERARDEAVRELKILQDRVASLSKGYHDALQKKRFELAGDYVKSLRKAEKELAQGMSGRSDQIGTKMTKEGVLGQASTHEAFEPFVFVLPHSPEDLFEDTRSTIVHEQGHRKHWEPYPAGGRVIDAWSREFKPRDAPTKYGRESPREDFAESFALAVGTPSHTPLWRDLDEDRKFVERYDVPHRREKMDSRWNVDLDALKKSVRDRERVKEKFGVRKEWLEKNVEGFGLPSARERAEASLKPKSLAAYDALNASEEFNALPRDVVAKYFAGKVR